MESFVYSRWRVLLDGVEVPYQELSTSFSTGAGAQAVISLEPDALIADINAQTIVHIFIRDHAATGDSPEDYLLFFEGMVIGYEHSKSPTSRSLTLQCVGLINILDQFKAYALAIGPLLYSSLLTGSTQLPIFIPNNEISVNQPQISALVEMAGVMSAEGAVVYADKLVQVVEKTAKYNVLLRQHLLRFRLLDRFVGIPDNVIGSLLSAEVVSSLISNIDAAVSAEFSVMDIVQYFASIGFYITSPIPLPHTPKQPPTSGTLPPDQYTITRTHQRNDHVIHPQMYTILPPPCNIVFPESLISLSVVRNKLVEPTRYMMFDPAAAYGGYRMLSYFAPADIVDRADATTPQQLAGIPLRTPNTTNPYTEQGEAGEINLLKSFSARELEKGLLASVQNMQTREHSFSLIAAKLITDRNEAVSQNIDLVNHFYELKQFSGTSATVVITGHRWIVPGFSCVIHDNDIIYHGNVVSVNFSRSTNGSETTTVVMDYVRPLSQLQVRSGELAADIQRVEQEFLNVATPPNVSLLQELSTKYALPVPPYFTSDALIDLKQLDDTYATVLGCKRFYSTTSAQPALDGALTADIPQRRLILLKEYLVGVQRILDIFKNRPKTLTEQEARICSRDATTLSTFLVQNELELQSIGSASSWVLLPKKSVNGWDDSIFSKLVADDKDATGAIASAREKFSTAGQLKTGNRQAPIILYALKHFTKRLFDGG
jgi:hypothetical protein